MKTPFRSFWILCLIPLLTACPLLGPGSRSGELDVRAVGPCNARGNPQNCFVSVTVQEIDEEPGCRVEVPAAQDRIEFDADRSNRGRTIAWTLTSAPAGYVFSRDGIVIPGDPGEREFVNRMRHGDGLTYQLKNLNQLPQQKAGEPNKYKYSIWVEKPPADVAGASVRCELDPWIYNLR